MFLPSCDKPVLLFDRSTLPLLSARGFYFADGKMKECSEHIDRLYDGSFFSPFKFGLYRREEKMKDGTLRQAYFCDTERADSFFVVDFDGVARPLFILAPCGHCDLCHQSRREDIAARLDAEASLWSCPPLFVTLTYNNEHLPKDGVSKEHITLFLKRLKQNLDKYDYNPFFRYFLNSEYGHDGSYVDCNGKVRKGTSRPHYHAIFYGIQVSKNKIDEIKDIFHMSWSDDRRTKSKGTFIFGNKRLDDRCFGNVDVQFLRKSGAGSRYASKYLHKPQVIPAGKNKTFTSFSRRPAVGLGALSPSILNLFRNLRATDVKIKNFDGTNTQFRLTKYFFQKVFPTASRLIPVEVRKNIYRVENLLSIFHEFQPIFFESLYAEFEPLFKKFRHNYRKQYVCRKIRYSIDEITSILRECYDSLNSFAPDFNFIEHIQLAKDVYLSRIHCIEDLTYKRIKAKEINNFVELNEHLY